MSDNATTLHSVMFLVGCLALAMTLKFTPTRLRLPISAAVVLITGAAIWLTIPAVPTESTVNGTYRNPCCAPIVLADGVLVSQEHRVPFHLSLPKHGLIGELKTPIEVRNGDVVASSDATSRAIVFDERRGAFTVCGPHCAREYIFTRA